jgi:hypothetical protein
MSHPSRTSVHPILWRITWPLLRTYLEVETPTLAVWGATGLPTSAPTGLMEEIAFTWTLPSVNFGNCDQGPVHSTTTTIRIRNGSKAARTECREGDLTCRKNLTIKRQRRPQSDYMRPAPSDF